VTACAGFLFHRSGDGEARDLAHLYCERYVLLSSVQTVSLLSSSLRSAVGLRYLGQPSYVR
jgi:hypothetical protein